MKQCLQEPAVTIDGDTVRLHGAAAVRAVAHPARMRVVDELFSGAIERTATELAEMCGLSPSAMSYHLRALEKFGIIVRAAARDDGRERPWRGRGRRLTIDNSDAAVTADGLLVSLAFDRTRAQYDAWMDYRRAHGADRPLLSGIANVLLWLTRSEAETHAGELDEVLDRFTKAADDRAGDPDSDRYAWSWTLFPDASAIAESAAASQSRGSTGSDSSASTANTHS